MKDKINGYLLSMFEKAEDKEKTATLELSLKYGFKSTILGYIDLDKSDVDYLLNKYKNTEIENKEIELSKTISKLNKIKEEIELFKNLAKQKE